MISNEVIEGYQSTQLEKFYNYPIVSTCIGIYTIFGFRDAVSTNEINDIYSKCFIIPSAGSLNVTNRVNSCSPTIMNLSPLGPSSQPTPHSLNSSSRLPFSYDINSRAAHTTLQYNAQSVLSENEIKNQFFHDLQPAGSIASFSSQANMQVQDVHVEQFADIAPKIVQAEIHNSHKRLEDIIFQGLNGLSERFGQIAYEVRELKRKYDEVILHSNGDRHNHLRENITSEMKSRFPLKTIDDMNDFKRQLQDAEMMEALVNMLFLCGGVTYHKGIYTYMKKMFHPELASLRNEK
ncbi:hypothetical protein FQA39_LY04670 [Lamprigera yunnana]|nr:hypothetical protein FQA39_LY04670 [Lamprigera yunnana]